MPRVLPAVLHVLLLGRIEELLRVGHRCRVPRPVSQKAASAGATLERCLGSGRFRLRSCNRCLLNDRPLIPIAKL